MKDNRRNNFRGNRDRRKGGFNGNPYNILPPSRILESYEQIAPGSVDKLLEMAKKEQEHRHSWQDKYLKSHNLSYRIGQFCGIIYNFAILYLVIHLIKTGEKDLAIKLFAINFGLMAFAILVTFVERKLVTRKPPRRGQKPNRVRPSNPTNTQSN